MAPLRTSRLRGKSCKALVTDLDNTLWGGVIGEDGMEGIRLGNDYSGAPFQALQRVMLDLYQRGIILAVCSKNNLADAMEALEKHPGMLLKPDHFAALRINWTDKAQNLREIAAELNIGHRYLSFFGRQSCRAGAHPYRIAGSNRHRTPDDPMDFAQSVARDSGI